MAAGKLELSDGTSGIIQEQHPDLLKAPLIESQSGRRAVDGARVSLDGRHMHPGLYSALESAEAAGQNTGSLV